MMGIMKFVCYIFLAVNHFRVASALASPAPKGTMDVVKVYQAYENEVAPASEPPSEIMDIPLFDSFFNHPDQWERIYFHVVGVRPQNSITTSDAAGIKARRSIFNLKGKVNPCVTVETIGDDTGSEDYFSVGSHSFSTKKGAVLPSWDERCVLLCKKGSKCTSGIKVTIINKKNKKEIMSATIDRSQFPRSGEDWKEIILGGESTSPKDPFDGMELKVKLRLADCTDKVISQEDIANFCNDSEDISYTEEVIEGDPDHTEDNAIVQCWRHKNAPASKAVLWFLGRNDCFMHPHVAKELFLDQGFDVYVLNWSAVGICRKRGWVTDAYFNSHNRIGDASLYLNQIDEALKKINSNPNYKDVLGYAHSTGGVILMNYLIERGDQSFDGFIFNSPFLSWRQVGVTATLVEKVVTPMAKFFRVRNTNSFLKTSLFASPPPKELLNGKSLDYLDREVDVYWWSMILWSQYHFDFRARPFYAVPLTVGFIDFVAKVDAALLNLQKKNRHVTLKPVICFATKEDDTLYNYEKTLGRINAIGPSRCEVQLRLNEHDIFLSFDEKDNKMAMDVTKVWMRTRGFVSD